VNTDADTSVPDARQYGSYADLARQQRRGRDYEIHVRRRPSLPVAVIAPHGGGIEDGTSELARAIAGDDFNLYLFEGTRPSGNYAALHLTSHLFDEPECLALIARCEYVVAVHGCAGDDARVLLGGLDLGLKQRIGTALWGSALAVQADGHRFPATHANNVVNRGARGRGVQLEITHSLRRSTAASTLAAAVRSALESLADGRSRAPAATG
jgi:phage replication-related protein YjqB (UPF0714/DUF867 family)